MFVLAPESCTVNGLIKPHPYDDEMKRTAGMESGCYYCTYLLYSFVHYRRSRSSTFLINSYSTTTKKYRYIGMSSQQLAKKHTAHNPKQTHKKERNKKMSRASFHQLHSSIISSSAPHLHVVADASTPGELLSVEHDKDTRESLSPRASVTYESPFKDRQRDRDRERRRGSVHPLQDFSLKHHVFIIIKFSFRLIRLLVHGTSIWMVKFFRLLGFVVALLPAFCVFAGFYFVMSDRIALPYIADSNPLRTSRHYLDIYGSTSTSTNYRHTTNSAAADSPQKKPVVIFFTGGAWVSIQTKQINLR